MKINKKKNLIKKMTIHVIITQMGLELSHYGQHSKHKTSFEENRTFQNRLTDIFVDKLLKH